MMKNREMAEEIRKLSFFEKVRLLFGCQSLDRHGATGDNESRSSARGRVEDCLDDDDGLPDLPLLSCDEAIALLDLSEDSDEIIDHQLGDDSDTPDTSVKYNSPSSDVVRDESQGLPAYIIPHTDRTRRSAFSRHTIKHGYCDETVVDVAKLTMPADTGEKSGSFPFRYKESDCMLQFEKPLTILASEDGCALQVFFSRPTEYYRFEDEPREIPCRFLCAVDDETFALFSTYEDNAKKAAAIQTFFEMTPKQQEFVRKQAKKKREAELPEQQEERFTPIQDREPLQVMYNICKHTYPPRVRARIETLFKKLSRSMGEAKADILTQLSYSMCIDTAPQKRSSKTFEEIIRILDSHIYGMDELKERIAEYLLAMDYAGINYFCILLVGPPGVGKTAVCDAISEILEAELVHVDCSGQNMISFGGLVKTYGGAQPGTVSSALLEAGKTDVLLRLDELDKLVQDRDGDAFSALIKPFGSARLFHDNFLADDIDMANCKIICTANRMDKIPGYILNRFGDNVFFLPSYNAAEKADIAEKYIIPEKLKEFHIGADEIHFDREALMCIAQEYCSDSGAREMAGYIETLLRKAIRDWCTHAASKPLTITADYVRTHIKRHVASANQKRAAGF